MTRRSGITSPSMGWPDNQKKMTEVIWADSGWQIEMVPVTDLRYRLPTAQRSPWSQHLALHPGHHLIVSEGGRLLNATQALLRSAAGAIYGSSTMTVQSPVRAAVSQDDGVVMRTNLSASAN